MKRPAAILSCALLVTGLLAGACSSGDSGSTTTLAEKKSKKTTTTTTISVDTAFSAFCASADDYVDQLDKFTGFWSGGTAGVTVGDVQEGASSLQQAGDQVEANAVQLKESVAAADAQDAKEAADGPDAPTSTTILPDISAEELVAQVNKAETDFANAVSGIDASTPVDKAGTVFTSAAFELQVAWWILLTQAGCVEDEGAVEQVRQYVAALQTDLKTLGYYTGNIDGIYGPETTAAVQAFQKAVDLPVTGLPDPATQKAISDKLAAQASANVAALQGLLAGLGLYSGPIDGQWSPAVENAVKALQAALGVPQTGVMDHATLVAYAERKAGLQELLAAEERNATSTTAKPAPTAAPTTAAPTTAAPTTAAPTTAAPTTTTTTTSTTTTTAP